MSNYTIVNVHCLEVRLADNLKKVEDVHHHCPEYLKSLIKDWEYDTPRYVCRIYDTGHLFKTI